MKVHQNKINDDLTVISVIIFLIYLKKIYLSYVYVESIEIQVNIAWNTLNFSGFLSNAKLYQESNTLIATFFLALLEPIVKINSYFFLALELISKSIFVPFYINR